MEFYEITGIVTLVVGVLGVPIIMLYHERYPIIELLYWLLLGTGAVIGILSIGK